MKRAFISIFLILTICLTLSVQGYAYTYPEISADGTGAVNMRLISDYGTARYSVFILKPGETLETIGSSPSDSFELVDEIAVEQDGEVTYDSADLTMKFGSGVPNGVYTAIIGGGELTGMTIKFAYPSPADEAKAVEEVNNASNETALETALNDNQDIAWCIDTADETYLNNKNAVLKSMLSILDQGAATALDVTRAFSMACTLTELKTCGETEVYDKLLFSAENLVIDLGEYADENSAEFTQAFINLRKGHDLNTPEDFADLIRASEALGKLNASTRETVIEILEEYNDVFGLNFSGDYRRVDQYQLAKKLVPNTQTQYISIAQVEEKFTQAIAELINAEGNGGATIVGGNRGSVSSVWTDNSNTSANQPVATAEPAVSTAFTDLDLAEWAKPYILYLYDNGIMNGYGDGTFRPDLPVSREELLKIIIEALEISADTADTEIEFEDVESGAWYETYIYTGVQSGIVQGFSSTEFGVGLPVTRQDAAVMILRAVRHSGQELSEIQEEQDFTDYEDIADYAVEAVLALQKAGIINGYDTGDFRPEAELLRCEAAKIIYSTLNGLVGSSQQENPEVEQQARNTVNTNSTISLMNQLGFVNETAAEAAVLKSDMLNIISLITGSDDAYYEKFFNAQETSEPLLYRQAIQVLIELAGYTPYAQAIEDSRGIAPGYLEAAKRIGIIKNTDVGEAQTISVEEFADLLYTALAQTPLMNASSFTGDLSNYTVDENETVLSRYMNIRLVEGVVNGVGDVSNDSRDGSLQNDIKINNQWYTYEQSGDAFAFYGYRIEAFVDEENNMIRAIAAREKDNNVLELKSEEINGNRTTVDRISYYNGSGTRTGQISSEADVIFNREIHTSYTADDFRRENSYYKFIDNDKDNIYDVVIIEQYTSALVSAVSPSENRIVDMNGSVYDLEEYFENGGSVYNEADSEVTLEKIMSYDVISFLIGGSGQIRYAGLSSQKVSGAMQQSREDFRYITINDTEYETTGQYRENASKNFDVNIGDSVTAFLDINGLVVDIEQVSSQAKAAYVKTMGRNGAFNVYLGILDEDGELKTVTLSNRIILDEERISSEDLINREPFYKNGEFVNQLILYRMNSNGEVIWIDTAQSRTDGTTGNYSGLTKNYDSDNGGVLRAITLNGTKVIGSKYVATDECVLFGVSDDAKYCYVNAGTGIDVNRSLDIEIYNVNNQYEPQYIVVSSNRQAPQWVSTTNSAYLVDEIVESVNEDNEKIYIMYYYDKDGTVGSRPITDGEITSWKYGNTLSHDTSFENVAIKDVPRGTVVQFLADSEGIYSYVIQHMPKEDGSEMIFEGIADVTGDDYGVTEYMFNGAASCSYGMVISRTEKGIVVNNHTPTDAELGNGEIFPIMRWNRFIPLSASDPVLIYDKTRNEVSVSDASCIVPGDMIFTKRNNTTYGITVVYR